MLVLFAITFAWIGLSFVASVAGFCALVSRRLWPRPRPEPKPLARRTAMLMPTYNEDPSRIFAAIEAMAVEVDRLGQGHAFDWFVLADTTDPDVALQEEAALIAARQRLGSKARVFYRRRRNNTAKKAGNVADFCRRWARAYDHILVLDADSLMDAETVVELARRMEADPDAGLIQTIPALVNGTTIVSRLQQFAGASTGRWWERACLGGSRRKATSGATTPSSGPRPSCRPPASPTCRARRPSAGIS